MPTFEISGNKLLHVEQKNFTLEKELQTLIENSLVPFQFNSDRLVL